ncbi:DUF2927 domain-containing protein [Pseudaestuariivita rosea]|uniref:DUF2927 domain-containing protein n=1 Tax=Pseudaestuariivita rosea TaxID=2763263 RepID=UPI001ABBB561|nr:DUF2927 domain-containing protein [Pseudaestuariivita rosea]
MRYILIGLVMLSHIGTVRAQEYIESTGRLTDAQFYDLISCAAPPGADCQKPVVKWPARMARSLRVSITQIDDGYPDAVQADARAALRHAVREINGVNSGVQLQLLRDNADTDVHVWMVDMRSGQPVTNSGYPDMDGFIVDGAGFYVWWDGRLRIYRSIIILPTTIPENQMKSLVLEETIQSLGLMTDIDNPNYSRSIFSQYGPNDITTLNGQDRMVLLRHYPNVVR